MGSGCWAIKSARHIWLGPQLAHGRNKVLPSEKTAAGVDVQLGVRHHRAYFLEFYRFGCVMDEYRSSTSESISCFFAAAVSAFVASRSSDRMHEARCRCRIAPVAGSTVNSSADGPCSSRALPNFQAALGRWGGLVVAGARVGC